MSEPSSFLSKITAVIDAHIGAISSDDATQINSFIRERIAQQRRGDLRTSGKCLGCQSVDVSYWPLSVTHKQRGDKWLDATALKWTRPPSVDITWSDIKVNGFKLDNIAPYLCTRCVAQIDVIVGQERQLAERDRDDARQSEIEIVQGERRATPAKRFWLLRKFDHEPDALRALPYKMFLQSLYWDIVRNYVRYKRGYRCEMCAAGDPLNVHHKTYEHHGDEHRYLEDLILLCSECHAKFHDKLAA